MTKRQNPRNKPWLVLKFGGTSIGKFLNNIARDIIRDLLSDYRVVVVCSARSSASKKEGTTSRLIRAAESVVRDLPSPQEIEEQLKRPSLSRTPSEISIPATPRDDYRQILNDICDEHLEAAREHVRDPKRQKELINVLQKECDKLRSFLEATETINEMSPRSRDIVIGTGERLACLLVTATLEDIGIDAQYVSLERVVQRHFDSEHLDQGFYDYLAQEMGEAVRRCGDRIPVVTGYFGMVPGGVLRSVGRGYTDLTAALVAVGLGAQELQVWKEVDGIFTADPRKVPRAYLLPMITPEEAAELTYYGSEVIHPFTMEQVVRARIPIRIKNVQNPTGNGTVIFPDYAYFRDVTEAAEKNSASASPPTSRTGPSRPPSPSLLMEHGYDTTDMSRRYPTAVTLKDDVIVLNIHSNRKSASHGFLAHVFLTLNEQNIPVDLISTSEVHVSMALGANVNERSLRRAIRSLNRIGTVDVLRNMAILSLVGRQMRNLVGIAGRMFAALADVGVNIEMISQGASEINISCVIDRNMGDRALNVIHDRLIANQHAAAIAANATVTASRS